MLNAETRVLTKEFLKRFSLMGGGIIQQSNDWATQMPQQLPQKYTDLLLFNVVKKEQIVETKMVSLGAE